MGLRQRHRRGATAWRWDGLEQFLTQVKTVGRISFLGGPADEPLYVSTSAFVGARLGDGTDDVFVASPRRLTGRRPSAPARAATTSTSSPTARGRRPPGRARPRVGLAEVRRPQRPSYVVLVSGFESADLHARSVVMAGSAGRDSLVAWSCNVEATGRGGADRLGMITQGRCGPGTRRALFGGAGDDRLNGNSFADLLVGGPGTDRADGYDGRDRWDAETERRCELPAAHVRATA